VATLFATETAWREDVFGNRKRRDVIGDKVGKRDKEKRQKLRQRASK